MRFRYRLKNFRCSSVFWQWTEALLSQPQLILGAPIYEFLPGPLQLIFFRRVPVEVAKLHHQAIADMGDISFVVCMEYLDRAPTMDASPPSDFNELSYGVTKTEIIKMVIEYHRLQMRWTLIWLRRNANDKKKGRKNKGIICWLLTNRALSSVKIRL